MKTILAPVDFSQTADNAAMFAAHLADAMGVRLVLLHVFSIPMPVTEMPVIIPMPDDLKKEYEDRLQKTADRIAGIIPSLKTEVRAVAGFATEEITALASRMKADLIVMGLHGAGRMEQIFIGSTAATVFGKAPCPVLVVPEHAAYARPEKIVYAFDFSETHDHQLRLLSEWETLFDAKVMVLNIIPPDQSEKFRYINLQYIEDHLPLKNYTVDFYEREDVVKGIAEYADQMHADLIVMTPHHHGFFEKIFRQSHTREMAFRTHLPLLALHEEVSKV